MNMQDQLQKLADAVSALEGSKARARLLQLFDEGTFVEIDRLARDGDKPAEVAAGYGLVDGSPVYAFAQDRDVCCGAIGRAQGAKIRKVYDLAAQNGAPLVGIFDSDGAKLGEGIDAMDAIADILLACNNLSGVVPQIAVVAGACVGSSAIIASAADIVVAAKDADFYLNPGDENAVPSLVAEDAGEAIEKAKELLRLLPANNLAVPVAYEFDSVAMGECEDIHGVIDAVADTDTVVRLGDGACETALARVGGAVCGLVTLAEDKLSCCSCGRVARFVRLCDSFSLPVVTFVDAAGFVCLKGAAKVSQAYAEATTAKITVLVGKAYGPVYIAVAGKSAGADAVLGWPTASVLPLAPEAAIHIFWKDRLAAMENPTEDRKKLAAEYAQTEGSVLNAAAAGTVTDVIAPADTKGKLIAMLELLSSKRVTRLPKKHANIQL
ncbi:MAG TPA: carboxyl transferase [Firmicutes bacterium]|nr:carboxyl transferase [Bacillota bacterium]